MVFVSDNVTTFEALTMILQLNNLLIKVLVSIVCSKMLEWCFVPLSNDSLPCFVGLGPEF